MIIGIEEEKGRVDSKSIPKRHKSEEEEEMPFFCYFSLFYPHTFSILCVNSLHFEETIEPWPVPTPFSVYNGHPSPWIIIFFSSSCYWFAMQHRSRIEELLRWFRHTVATCLPITIKPFGGRDIFLIKSRSLWLNCCSCFVFFSRIDLNFGLFFFLILQYATESRARFCFDVAESPPNG